MKTIGLAAFGIGGVVDLADHLVRLVGRVDEGPAHVARLDRELRHDRVAEGLGGDAGAVRDEKHGAIGHGAGFGSGVAVDWDDRQFARAMRGKPRGHRHFLALNSAIIVPAAHERPCCRAQAPRASRDCARLASAPGRCRGGRDTRIFQPPGALPCPSNPLATALVAPFEQLRMTDVESVGGKNASLGEMISQLAASGVRVPGGFATTAHAFRSSWQHEGLAKRIEDAPRDAEHRRRARARRSRRARFATGSSRRRFRPSSMPRSPNAFANA